MPAITQNELNALCNQYNNIEPSLLHISIGHDRFEFRVKYRLNMAETSELVEFIRSSVLNKTTLNYSPELKDYYTRIAVIDLYTDITLPDDEEMCWRLVYDTPIFAMITGHERRPVEFNGREYDDNIVIDTEQYEQILDAINKKIEFELSK